MNRRLQAATCADPQELERHLEKFNQLPECIEEFLDYGTALSCAFNAFGTLLATGTNSGHVGIWDFETRGLAKVLPSVGDPDPAQVVSVCWSSNGRYLLSGHAKPERQASDRADKAKGEDRIVLWDVEAGKPLREVPMPSGVTKVCLSGLKPWVAVVSLRSGPPLVVELAKEKPHIIALDAIDLKAALDSSGGSSKRGHSEVAGPVALLSKSVREVYVAQQQSGKGFLLVYDLKSKQLLDIVKLPAPVATMSLNKPGSHLLLNCEKSVSLASVSARPAGLKPVSKDKAAEAVRTAAADAKDSLLRAEGCELVSVLPCSYSNPVEREAWVGAEFSHNGQHVVTASASTSYHMLHIFDVSGQPQSVLRGPQKEGIKAVAWHPKRNMMVSISTTGRVYIWAQIYNEEWSAFAPDFKELHENIEYEEQEDEFDLNHREPSSPQRDAPSQQRQPARIDVVKRPRLEGSDAEDEAGPEGPLRWLPAEYDPGTEEPAAEKEGTPQSSDDASDDDAGPETSGRTAAEADSDGGGTDQPRERKRKAVRFEGQYDDKAFDDLMKMQEEYQKKLTPSTGARRGRPPKPKPRDAEGPP